MPVKEIMSLAMAAVVGIAISGGPQNLTRNLRKTQFKILREAARTDNWGNAQYWKPYVHHVGLHRKISKK